MMEKTMQINGMMCNHCKMTVEKAIKAVPGVENAEVDLAAKCAKITLNADVADDAAHDGFVNIVGQVVFIRLAEVGFHRVAQRVERAGDDLLHGNGQRIGRV